MSVKMFKNTFGKKNNRNYEDIKCKCIIRFLDESTSPIHVSYAKDAKGNYLIDYVCNQQNILEKDYFGLRYVDNEKQRHWLEPLKTITKQLKNVEPVVLCFRVKFYPAEILRVQEELTRYQIFLQLRRDLHHGRLLCGPSDANLLAAYIIQSEVGDYHEADCADGYISQFKMLPKQTNKQEEKIHELHKTLSGQVPNEAESNFLKKAASLDTYGVDPHPVKDQKGNQMYLGITHLGIVTFQGNKRTHLFKWEQINKIAFEGKMFIVHVTITEDSQQKKHACGFKCPTFSACKHLWKCAIQQQYFFTLSQSTEAPKVTSGGGIFTRGSKFRFSGRCQKEVFIESALIRREQPSFQRSASNPHFVRNYQANKFNTLPHPNRRPTDINDATIETANRVSMPALPNSLSECEQLDKSIPEEEAHSIAEQDYSPQSDTSVLDDKILQEQTKLTNDYKGQEEHDLDTEVKEMEHMFSKMDNFVSNEKLPPYKEDNPVKDGVVSQSVQSTTTTTEQSYPLKKKSSFVGTCCRRLMCILFTLFIISAVLMVVLYETNLKIPVLSHVKDVPEVHRFKNLYYDPIRTTLTSYFNRIQKRMGSK